jgi:uncharacterized protein (TIRG00374 family)
MVLLLAYVIGRTSFRDRVRPEPGAEGMAIVREAPGGVILRTPEGEERFVPDSDFASGRAVRVEGVISISRRLGGRWGWAVAALAVMLLQSPVGAVRWRILLKVQGIRITFLESLRLTYIGWFFNCYLPGATGGDFVKAYYIARQTHQKAEAVTVVFLDRFIGVISLCILGGLAVAVSLGDERLRVPQAILAVLLALTAVGTLVFYSRRMRRLVRLDRLISRLPLGRVAERVDRSVFVYRYHKRAVLAAVGCGWLAQAASVLATWFIATGLGSHAAWYHYFVAMPVIWVVWSVVPVPGGVGVAEGLAQEFFGPAAVAAAGETVPLAEAASLALAMMLCFRLVQIIVSLPGAVLYLTRRTGVSPRHMRQELEQGEAVGAPASDSDHAAESRPRAACRAPEGELAEYVGAIHLHSCYSDGSGTVREMAAAARRADIDFFVLTDHDTAQPRRDGWEGWRDGVLVIPGAEVTCEGDRHVVAIGATEVSDLFGRPLQEVLTTLQARGGMSFIAHAHPARIHLWGMELQGLEQWELPGFTGVELWSFMQDVCDGLRIWQVPAFPFTWRRRSTGPFPDTLRHYDAITQRRRFVAVGALDNHAYPPLRTFWPRVIPYEAGFRSLRTHVFCEPLAGDSGDSGRVMRAVGRGRAFLALDSRADARGFRFQGTRGGHVLAMGDERTWDGPVRLEIASPSKARLRILRNGEVVAEADEGAGLTHEADEPGVYRAEAHLGGKPWVYTNPIYLRPEAAGSADGGPA